MKPTWQLARVIDPELPFVGRFLWVKGPPETFVVGEWPPTRALRTNVRVRGRSVWIRLASIELQSVGKAVRTSRDIWYGSTRVAKRSIYPFLNDTQHALNPARLSGGFAREVYDA